MDPLVIIGFALVSILILILVGMGIVLLRISKMYHQRWLNYLVLFWVFYVLRVTIFFITTAIYQHYILDIMDNLFHVICATFWLYTIDNFFNFKYGKKFWGVTGISSLFILLDLFPIFEDSIMVLLLYLTLGSVLIYFSVRVFIIPKPDRQSTTHLIGMLIFIRGVNKLAFGFNLFRDEYLVISYSLGFIIAIFMMITLLLSIYEEKESDIRKEMEKSIELQAIRQRKKSIESIGTLAAGISHDYNNFLTVILGNLSLLREDLADNPEYSRYINDGIQFTLKAKDLSQKLISFSEGGYLLKSKSDFRSFIIEIGNHLFHGSRIDHIYDIPKDLPLIEYDIALMQDVFNQLIINTKEAMSTGGEVLIRAKIERIIDNVRVPLPTGNYLHISYQDNGPGIPSEIHNKIFDPFFSTKPKNQGLGLTTVYSIIRQHKGYVELDHNFTDGALFHIWIPC